MILSVALGLRVAVLIAMTGQIDDILAMPHDGRNYLAMAADILGGTDHAQKYLFSFGPGYAFFLAGIVGVFGHHALPILLIQILLSTASCLVVYMLADELLGDRRIAAVAAFLLAVSYTSITLTNMVLSDSLYFFLFSLMLLLFVRLVKGAGILIAIITGLILGAAILTRSIGQFFPLALILMLMLLQRTDPKHVRIRWRNLVLVLVTVSILIAPWVAYVHHTWGRFEITSGAPGGFANVAALTVARLEGGDHQEVRLRWIYAEQDRLGKTHLARHENLALNYRKAREVFSQHPWKMIQAYLDMTWENLTAINYLGPLVLPERKALTEDLKHIFEAKPYQYFPTLFAVLGLVILAIRQKWQAFVVLGLTFAYCTFTIGFTRWQGSRLFYPGYAATLPLIAVFIVAILDGMLRVDMRLGGASRATQKSRPE